MHGLNVDLHKIELVAGWAQKFESLIDALICPPTTLIRDAARIAEGRLEIGGQDCHSEVSGAHTGDFGAEMLRDAGASVVLVGHSERRQNHGEADALVAAKARRRKARGPVRNRMCRRDRYSARERPRPVDRWRPDHRERTRRDADKIERAAAPSGIGASIAANKIVGIRAGLIHDVFSARQGVEDDDINVLCMGGSVVGAFSRCKSLRPSSPQGFPAPRGIGGGLQNSSSICRYRVCRR